VDKRAQTPPSAKRIDPKEHENSELGGVLLESLRGKSRDSVIFGQEETAAIEKPGKASKAHIDAINTIASASRKKPKK